MNQQKRTFGVLSVVIVLALLLAGCAGQAGTQTGSNSAGFTGNGTVSKVSYTDTVEATGVIQPQHIASLYWTTTGKVAQSNVTVGQKVNAGETLMTLDQASVSANLLTAQTDLTNARNAMTQLTNPDLSTISNAEKALAAAYSNYQQAQSSLTNAIITNQNANDLTIYNDWINAKTALDAARNNMPLANGSIDVQAFYQAVRKTNQLQEALTVAQDNVSAHPEDTALAQKVADLQVAVQDSSAKQANLQAALPADTANLVSTLSDKLSAYEASTNDFIGSVITDTTNTSVDLAQIQADLAQKQSTLLSTQTALTDLTNKRLGMNGQRCDSSTIADYQTAYDRALAAYNFSGHVANSREYQQLQAAAANLNWCTAVWSEADIAAQDAKIASTQAQIQLLQAQITADQTQITDATNSVFGLAIDLNTVWTAYQDASQQLSNAVTHLYELERSPNLDDLAAARARLQAAQAAVDSLTLTSPYDGEVTSVDYLTGDSVDSKTPAVVLVDRSKLYVDLQIDESHVVKLSPGNKATIILEAMPTLTLTGSVSYINPVGTSNQGVVYYDVRVVLDQSDPKILIGATADVTIYAGQPQDVLTVPVSAVGSDTQGEYVYVMNPDGSTQQVTIVSGQILPDDTVIVTGNLQEGQTVGLLPSTSTGTNSGGFPGGGGGRFIGP
jgi:multidrug efflux pump subunit AcrA (membrane-fusion protein)